MRKSARHRATLTRPAGTSPALDAGYLLPEDLLDDELVIPARVETSAKTERLRAALWLLLLGYFVVGVFGRFPWKADEPYSFGIVREMLEDGDWLIPHVADQSFVEKPPLVYWLGAVSAKLFPAVPPHESSRLAVLILVAATVLALYRSAGHLWPETRVWCTWLGSTARPGPAAPATSTEPTSQPEYALLAILLFAGTLGLQGADSQAHRRLGAARRLCHRALRACSPWHVIRRAHCRRAARRVDRGRYGGRRRGCGIHVQGSVRARFDCTDLAGVLDAATLSQCCREDCRWDGGGGCFALASDLARVAPGHLARPVPRMVLDEQHGRFLGQGDLGGTGVSLWDKAISLMLAAFPVWPLCATAVAWTWRARTSQGWSLRAQAPGHACVVMFVTASLVVLALSGTFRDNYLMPLLAALVLLAVPAMVMGSGRVGLVLKRTTDVAFAIAGAIVFLIWAQLTTVGTVWPSTLSAGVATILPLPFRLVVSWPSLVVAVSTMLLWQFARRRLICRSAAATWCVGIAMLWVVSFSLLLPWADAARSYQGVFTELRSKLVRPNCLSHIEPWRIRAGDARVRDRH